VSQVAKDKDPVYVLTNALSVSVDGFGEGAGDSDVGGEGAGGGVRAADSAAARANALDFEGREGASGPGLTMMVLGAVLLSGCRMEEGELEKVSANPIFVL
jgi:hypothetical protein